MELNDATNVTCQFSWKNDIEVIQFKSVAFPFLLKLLDMTQLPNWV